MKLCLLINDAPGANTNGVHTAKEGARRLARGGHTSVSGPPDLFATPSGVVKDRFMGVMSPLEGKIRKYFWAL